MSEITSLMRVDALQIKSYWKFVAAAAVFVVVVVLAGKLTLATPIAGAIGVIVAMGPISNAEVTGTDKLFGTLPVTRRSVIKAHYAVGIGCLLAVMLVMLLATVVAGLVGASTDGAVLGVASTAMGLVLVFALYAPIMLRFGSRVAGMMLVLMFGVMGVLGGSLYSLLSRTTDTSAAAGPAGAGGVAMATAAGALVTVVVTWVSYLISARIYERQDH